MRLPTWLRVRRQQKVGQSVEVELTIDTTRFDAAMEEVSEGSRKLRYASRLELERQLGRVHVGALLDDLCEHFGLDPATTWRVPRALEARERARAAVYADLANPSGYGRRTAERRWLQEHREHQAEQTRAREAQ